MAIWAHSFEMVWAVTSILPESAHFWRLYAIFSRSTPLGSNATIEAERRRARRLMAHKIGVKFFQPKLEPQSECDL
jgi:hypothetical protein